MISDQIAQFRAPLDTNEPYRQSLRCAHELRKFCSRANDRQLSPESSALQLADRLDQDVNPFASDEPADEYEVAHAGAALRAFENFVLIRIRYHRGIHRKTVCECAARGNIPGEPNNQPL